MASSAHALGQHGSGVLRRQRRCVAQACGASPEVELDARPRAVCRSISALSSREMSLAMQPKLSIVDGRIGAWLDRPVFLFLRSL